MTLNREALLPTKRFSNRAENYRRYRPSYPPEVISFLKQMTGLNPAYRVADIGSGTGLFSELLLRQGCTVVCIEPNANMREEAEKRLGHYAGFSSVPERAEQTGLEDHSVDLITVAQALQWMEPEATKKEFNRILKPGGHIALAWNIRQTHTPFLAAYDEIKQQFGMEPARQLSHDETIQPFFQPEPVYRQAFPHATWLDFDSLKGLLLSSSGIPLPGHSSYDTMISALVQVFVAYNKNGFVLMEYETLLYCQQGE